MHNPHSRRTFLLQAAASLAAPGLVEARYGSYANEMPDMLPTFVGSRLNALAARWDRVRETLTTPEAIEARNITLRENLRNMLHGAPLRNPLAPVVVATHKRSGYRVENVMFQSRPDFWVTGNLYIPDGAGPFPAVISPCGHYPWSRMEPEYQFVYMNMVRAGLVVLAYDPVGQGERRQYWDPRTNRTEVAAASTYEHSMPGQLLLLMGEDLTHYRVWDGVRAIDYLLTRPEVDGKRIGCAGHSGGGTLTMFIAAYDQRVACAVVNEGGTGHRWPVHLGGRIGPSDVEQNLFPAANYGIDSCDLLASVAPRPLLTLIEDFNPNFDSAVAHIRKRYETLGAADKFAADEASDPHSWTPKLRQATTNWFCRWFYNRPGPDREPDFEPEKHETLYCTPSGSLRFPQKGQSVWTLLRARAEKLPPARPAPLKASEVAEMLRFKRQEGPLAVRNLVTTPRKGYSIEKVEFLSEPGIYIPAWVFVPEKPKPGPVTLYFTEAGKEADGAEFGFFEKLTRRGHTIIAADVRGIGATGGAMASPREGNPFGHLFSGETGIAYLCWYMDDSLLGMRVTDVVRTVDYALSRPDTGKAGVRVVGKGAGAVWALFAAALDPRITEVQAERGLISYRALTTSDRYLHSAGIFLRDVLLRFDLPQVASIIPGKVTLISPVDHMKRPVEPAAARAVYKDSRIAINGGTFDLA